MTPNTVSPLDSLMIGFCLGAGISGVLAFFVWARYQEEKVRRNSEKESHRRRCEQLERCIDFFNERDRLAEAVRRQISDVPAVTLPVTDCERRERRRRFLPLEGQSDESH